MKHTLPIIGCIAIVLSNPFGASAQSKFSPETLKNLKTVSTSQIISQPDVKGKTTKTTLVGEPLLSKALIVVIGGNFVPQDSSHYSYSLGRSCYDIDNDDSIFYDRKEVYFFDNISSKYQRRLTKTKNYSSGNNVANSLDSVIDFGTGDFLPNSRIQNIYDASFNITSTLEQYWDDLTNTWINIALKSYTFDAANRVLTDKSEKWNKSTSAWEIIIIKTNTYNAAGSMLTTTDQIWDKSVAALINYERTTKTYDAAERELTSIAEYYDYTTSTLLKTTKYIQTYSATGKRTSFTNQSWNPTTSTFINWNRKLYTFDGLDHYIDIIDQNWDVPTTKWINQFRNSDFIYSPANNITFYKRYSWGAGVWTLGVRATMTYDATGNRLSFLLEAFPYGTTIWTKYLLETSTYNSNNDRTIFISESYDDASDTYSSKRNRSTYNGSHQLTRSLDDHDNGYGFSYQDYDAIKRYHYTETPTTIEENNLNNTIVSLYPVPAGDQCTINVQFATAADFSITVMDIVGRVWMQESHRSGINYKGIIDTKSLPSGSYFVAVQNASGARITKQISVIH